MAKSNNILEELKGLDSPLAKYESGQVYSVPDGYFDGLAGTVLARIKSLESAGSKTGELILISDLVSKLPVRMPYTVPAGYFDTLAERMLQLVRSAGVSQSVQEETETISPLLGSLKKEMPYQVPSGYFEQSIIPVQATKKPTPGRVVSMVNRQWFRYAAAAVVTGIIVLAGFLVLDQGSPKTEGGKVFAKVSRDFKKLSVSQQQDLIDFLDAGMTGTETAKVKTEIKTQEIQQLLQDIPEDELKIFQEQTEDIEDVLMIN